MSPFNTATLPGMITFLDFTLSSTFSLKNLEIELPENLPAAHGCQYRKSAGVVDYKVYRNSGSLELSGYQEIGQSKVYCGQADRIFRLRRSAVDARLYFHRFLWISINVLTKTKQWKSLCICHLLHNDDGTIFHCKHRC